jgi:hypothetical protein
MENLAILQKKIICLIKEGRRKVNYKNILMQLKEEMAQKKILFFKIK